jgi:hypothetical protein
MPQEENEASRTRPIIGMTRPTPEDVTIAPDLFSKRNKSAAGNEGYPPPCIVR